MCSFSAGNYYYSLKVVKISRAENIKLKSLVLVLLLLKLFIAQPTTSQVSKNLNNSKTTSLWSEC